MTTAIAIPVEAPRRGRASPLWRTVRRFQRNRAAVGGLLVLALLLTMSLGAPLLTSKDPEKISLLAKLERPSREYPMGTDQVGRDLWSRVLYGGRISLILAFGCVVGSVLIGLPLGMLAGYYGAIDLALSRVVEIMLAFPSILLALAIAASLGSGLRSTVVAIVVIFVPVFIRLARAQTQVIRRLTYIEAAQALGAGDARILRTHVLPNLIGPLLIQASLQNATALLLIASLGFLGLGVKPPTPEWGTIVAEGRSYLHNAPYITMLPGSVLFLAILAINLVGDGLRDAFDVRARE